VAVLMMYSAAGAPQKFTAPPPDNAKGTVVLYRLRSMLGAAWHPTLFANGDFVGDLHLANYTFYQAPPGRVMIISMDVAARFPPPTDLVPADSPCAALDWRHLGSATPAAVVSCKEFLSAQARLHSCIHNFVDCNKFSPFHYVLETVATRENPIGEDPTAVQRSGNFSNITLQLDVESGKTYYVEWWVGGSGAKMRQVDASTAQKKVRGLKLTAER
jgi:hypothetical protein